MYSNVCEIMIIRYVLGCLSSSCLLAHSVTVGLSVSVAACDSVLSMTLQVFYDLMRLVRDNKDRAAAAAAGGRNQKSATNGREPRRKKRCIIL